MNTRIELGDSVVGKHYFLTETYGPYVRVTSSQGNYLDEGLVFWFKTSSPEDIERVSTDTAHKGTVLHGLFAGHLAGEAVVIEHDWAGSPFESFKKFCIEQSLQPLEIEKTMVSRNLGLGGTVDAVAFLGKGEDRKKWILDWKTGAESESHGIQLALYAVMYWELTGEWVDNLGVIYVHRDGKKKVKFYHAHNVWENLRAGLLVFERWKHDNKSKLMWACAPQEVVEKRKSLRGKNRKEFEYKNGEANYVWPWLGVDSLVWLDEFMQQRRKENV